MAATIETYEKSIEELEKMISRGLMFAAAAALLVAMSAPAFADCADESTGCDRVEERGADFGARPAKPEKPEQEAPENPT